MATKQTIAIIGATGRMGAAIAQRLAKAAYRLLLMGHNKEKLEAVQNHIQEESIDADVEVVSCSHEACWEADIIVMAVPHKMEAELAQAIKDVAVGKVVVSIANPFNETYDGLVTKSGTSAAETLQNLLPHTKVVKAFNTIFAETFKNPLLEGVAVNGFVAGNDADAVAIVMAMVQAAGFSPLLAGDLSASRTLESMALLLMQLKKNNGLKGTVGWKVLHETNTF